MSCMRANRAAGRQVKIMGKPGVEADKLPEYITVPYQTQNVVE